jgi:hypothetical protein
MKRYLIYLRNVALFFVWLAVMLTPCFAVAFAYRGEMEWKRSDYESDRIWLIQERDQRGIGYTAVRVANDNRTAGGPLCVRTSARFFLWKGSSDNDYSDWCECYGADKTVTTSCK